MAKTDSTANPRLAAAAALTDTALLSHVCALAARERTAIADLVAHLAELDSRRLYRGEGYSSLFVYCTSVLRLSEQGAYNRIEAARAARRFPSVLDLLADGSLNLATLRLLAPHLTAQNFDTVVADAKGRSKRDVELVVARVAPRPDAPTLVRRLPAPTANSAAASRIEGTAPLADSASPSMYAQQSAEASTAAAEASAAATASVLTDAASAISFAPQALPSASKRTVVEPLSPERFRVQFTIGKETYDRLRRVQDLLRREIPDGDIAAIFERALSVLLAETERRKTAATTRPRAMRPLAPGSRHIPAQVRREVWTRDGGQCAYVAPNGQRCGAHAFLEFHHCRPWIVGGPPEVENITLRCRTHNVWEAEVYFGRASGTELAPGQVDAGLPGRPTPS